MGWPAEVPRWVRRFRKVLKNGEPAIATGAHCHSPFDCPFIDHCRQGEPPGPEFPLTLLPNGGILVQRLTELHPYDVPEIVRLSVDSVNQAYLDWVVAECDPGAASGRTDGDGQLDEI